MISEEQIEFIRAELNKSSITVEEVKDDLLDHFCCSIEQEIATGLSFEEAYLKAFGQVCPNGLNQIQNELFLLLNIDKIIGMKKFKYSVGFIASISISIGVLFKVMMWPGSTYMLLFGFSAFTLLFLPMLGYDTYKESDNWKSEKPKYILGFASAGIIFLATAFKIGHLMGAGVLLVVGAALFTFGFLPFLFLSMYRKSLNQKLEKQV